MLVTDAVVRGLAIRDARASAGQLSDVADDLALGLSQQPKRSYRQPLARFDKGRSVDARFV